MNEYIDIEEYIKLELNGGEAPDYDRSEQYSPLDIVLHYLIIISNDKDRNLEDKERAIRYEYQLLTNDKYLKDDPVIYESIRKIGDGKIYDLLKGIHRTHTNYVYCAEFGYFEETYL